MATNNPAKHSGTGRQVETLAKWLLGALGLVWLGAFTLRNVREAPISVTTGRPSADQRLKSKRFVGVAEDPVFPPSEPLRGHEVKDANAKWIFGLVIFLFVFGLGIHGILAAFLGALKRTAPPNDGFKPRPSAAQAIPARPPFPVLQVSPAEDLKSFRAHEEAELNGYGWIDRKSGIVHIPIERAMDLVLQEGLPTRTTTNDNRTGLSSYQLIQRRTEHRQQEIAP